MPPFISREDARRIAQNERRARPQTAFGGSAATTASPEAAAAWDRSIAEYGASGRGNRQALNDQTREAAYDPGADMFDKGNLKPVDMQGRTIWTNDYSQQPAPKTPPTTQLSSRGSIGDRVRKALQALPSAEAPPPVTSAEIQDYPNPGSLMPGHDLPDYQRIGGIPRGAFAYSPEELGVTTSAVPTAGGASPEAAARGANMAPVMQIAQALMAAGVPRSKLRGAISDWIRRQVPEMPRGGATYGGDRFGGATYGGSRFGGNTAGDIRGALDRTNADVLGWNGKVYKKGGPVRMYAGGPLGEEMGYDDSWDDWTNKAGMLASYDPTGYGGYATDVIDIAGDIGGGADHDIDKGDAFGLFPDTELDQGEQIGGSTGSLIGRIIGGFFGMPGVGAMAGRDVGEGAGAMFQGRFGEGFENIGRNALSRLTTSGGGIAGSFMGGDGGGMMGSPDMGMSGMTFKHGGHAYARGGYPQLRTAPVRTAFSTGGGDNYVEGDGQGDGRSDHIDAVLSPGEYVMDAETVSLMGDGDNEAGARAFDSLRENIRRHKGSKLAKGDISAPAKAPEQYLARGGRALGPKMRKVSTPQFERLSAADMLAHAGPRDTMASSGFLTKRET